MERGGQRIHLSEQTRHLVIQKLLIDYIYCQRSRQIDAIAVRSIAVLCDHSRRAAKIDLPLITSEAQPRLKS